MGFLFFLCSMRFLCCCLIVLAHSVFAQAPYFYQISDNDGLPSNEVYDLLQDKSGYIWMGTSAGLYSYDGRSFVVFKNAHSNGKSISGLMMGSGGRLWCKNFTGQIFSVTGDSLRIEYEWTKQSANFPFFSFNAKNEIVISCDSGIHLNGRVIPILQGKDKRVEFSDVLVNKEKIYFSTPARIGYIENGNVQTLYLEEQSKEQGDVLRYSQFQAFNEKCLVLARGEKNSLWVVEQDSLKWLMNLPERIGRIFCVRDDGNGKLWIGGSGGAMCFDSELNKLYDGQLFFADKSISDVLLDKEGNYWFSTLHDGIFVVPSLEVQVYTDGNSILEDTRIGKLEKDDKGNLFIGYHNGRVSRFHIQTRKTSSIAFPPPAVDVQAMCINHSNNTLLVAQSKVWKVNTTTMQPNFIAGLSNVKSLQCLGGDTFLMGSVGSAAIVKIGAGVDFLKQLRQKRANVVFSEKPHRFWVCYSDGLFVYDTAGEQKVKINGETVFANGIAQTANGIVWVSTSTDKILSFENGQYKSVLESPFSVPIEMVRGVYAHDKWLFIVCKNNLVCYNTHNNTFRTFNKFDGLPSNEISDIEFVNNKVFLATPKGLIQFPLELNSINKIAPKIYIGSVAIHDRDTVVSNAYTLPFKKNNISIQFKGIALRSLGEFTYRYRLLGLDSNWIETSSGSSFARYPSLPAGNYLFEVVAVNEDGIASESPAQLRIEILKPFWQAWWFYLLLALALSAVISSVFAWRIRDIQKQSALEKRVANSRLTTLKSQMNPHFMFNALNSIQDLVLQQDTEKAQLYLGKFSELTRKVLDASGMEFVVLEEEIEMLQLYLDLEKLRFGDELQYSLQVESNILPETLSIPSMLIQPFVENALKHGLLHKQGEKKLEVTFSLNENSLVCTIQDNGIGRQASATINAKRRKHKSFATNATNERLHLLKEYYGVSVQLDIMDMEQGTKVVLQIPKREV